uniref:NADH-ubiquinone oxidoreductase chain 3 n=1 Tax=Trocnadella arisana TaxID=1437250 RepID=A0A342KAG5_9HEMI|nr:NADH dehydrogenase subunit 3 [Trocnadella arisana]AMY96199.1 NADH dehydrogenase subunit 3 [Trocnadella arisana]
MIIIMMFCMINMMLVLILTLMVMIMMKKKKKNFNKMKPFECGFNSISKKRLPFSSHFFIVGMIFLIFDIEIIIIMPMIMTMKFSMLKYWLTASNMMIMILIMGLYYEWKNNMLKWTN